VWSENCAVLTCHALSARYSVISPSIPTPLMSLLT
jgi:hypothetical protein